MNLLSLWVILLILVASGGIAFVADGLGKKIGKKRLSVFGLRPKHVASLGTVLMGVFVSALTIGFIAAVSRDAREWLKEGGKLLVERDRLRDDLKLQKARLEGLNDQIRDESLKNRKAEVELERRTEQIGRLDTDLQQKNVELTEKNRKLLLAQSELDVRQRAIDKLQAQLPSLRAQVATAQAQVKMANVNLTAVKRSLVVVKHVLQVANNDLETARQDAKEAHADSERTKTKSLETYQALEEKKEELASRQKIVDELKAEEASYIAQRDQAQAQAEEAQARYAEVSGQLESAGRDLVQMQEALLGQAAFLNSGYKTSRTEAMTFRRGEEVARVVVPAGADLEAAQNALASLLRAARIEAGSRGAKGHRSGGQTFESADIVDRKDPKTGEVVDADTLKRAFAASLTGHREDQVLVATSSLNAFTGEPVSLDLAALPNPVVYHRNDMVAETHIDGRLNDAKIIAELSKFVNGSLRDHAAQARMIPRAGASAPFGEPTADDVWNVLQNVRKAGRVVHIRAFAGDDIRAGDPLRLEFRVR